MPGSSFQLSSVSGHRPICPHSRPHDGPDRSEDIDGANECRLIDTPAKDAEGKQNATSGSAPYPLTLVERFVDDLSARYPGPMATEPSKAAIDTSEQKERERRSSRRNLAGIFAVTFVSLGLVIGDIIRDLLQR